MLFCSEKLVLNVTFNAFWNANEINNFIFLVMFVQYFIFLKKENYIFPYFVFIAFYILKRSFSIIRISFKLLF